MQKVPEVTTNKRERKDLNQLLLLCVTKLREKMPGNLMAREPPASARNSFELPERPPKKQKEYEEQMKKQQEDGGGEPMSPKVEDKKPEPEDDRWRAKFLLKEPMDFDMMEHKCQSNQVQPYFFHYYFSNQKQLPFLVNCSTINVLEITIEYHLHELKTCCNCHFLRIVW